MFSDLDISIKYLKKDKVWHEIIIRPEDYFDMDYCEADEIDVDSVSKYDHALGYIDENEQSSVIATDLKRHNKTTGILIHITTSYWHNQTQMFIERKDFCQGKVIYNEFIISTEIEDDTGLTKCSIIRILHDNDSMVSKPISHRIFTELDDGSEIEQELDVW